MTQKGFSPSFLFNGSHLFLLASRSLPMLFQNSPVKKAIGYKNKPFRNRSSLLGSHLASLGPNTTPPTSYWVGGLFRILALKLRLPQFTVFLYICLLGFLWKISYPLKVCIFSLEKEDKNSTYHIAFSENLIQ